MSGWFPRLLLISIAFQASVYAIRPMVSYRALELGAGPVMIGVIASSYAALSLVAAVPVGRWVDRWGEARFMSAGLGLLAVTSLWLLWIDTLWLLTVTQAVMGLGHIMILLGSQTLVANASRGPRRDADFAMLVVVQSLGQLIGPAAAGFLAGSAMGAGDQASTGQGARLVFAAAGAAAVLATATALTLQWRPAGSGADHGQDKVGQTMPVLPAVRRVLEVRGMWVAMLASLTVLTTVDIMAAYLPLYGEANGLSVEFVGLLLAARAGASIASRTLMPRLIRLVGRRRLLALSMMVPAAALAPLPAVESHGLLVAGMLVIGFGLGLGQPMTLSWVAARAGADVRGTAIGVRLTGNRLGQVVLPSAVGIVAGAAGVSAIFPVLAALLILSGGLVASAPLDDDSEAPQAP
jgi:MFS family permease